MPIDDVRNLPKFVRKLFYQHDTARLNLGLNKTQINILLFLEEHLDKSMSNLSRMIGLEKSSFTRAMDTLVESGFLCKRYLADDRRVINISFTPKGFEAVRIIKEDWEGYFSSLIGILSEDEKNEFSAALGTVSRYINLIMHEEKK